MPSSRAWARRYAKPVSNAEWTLRDAFQQLGLLEGSLQNEDFPFNQEIFLETGFKGTNVDRLYPDLKLALFFDGPHHKTRRQAKKDEAINTILQTRFGYTVSRWMFNRMTKRLAEEIAGEAKKIIERLRLPHE